MCPYDPNPYGTPIVELTVKCDGNKHCHQPAVAVVYLHQVNCCHDDDLTPDGDGVLLLCSQCVRDTTELIEHSIELRRCRRPLCFECRTCGRPIQDVHDVLDVQRI